MAAPRDSVLEDLSPREVILRAVSVLTAGHHVSTEGALEMLVQDSAAWDVPVRDAARRVVRESLEEVLRVARSGEETLPLPRRG